jgi:hypothetical protein
MEDILMLEPYYWPTLLSLSYGYNQQGDLERAYRTLKRCHEIEKENPDVVSELGISAILSQLLINRNVDTSERAKMFLSYPITGAREVHIARLPSI